VTTYCVIRSTFAQKGPDGIPVAADIPVGVPGAFTVLSGQDAQWLHPYALRQVIAYARDAYRGGNLDFAKGVFTDYLNVRSQYGTPPPEFCTGLVFDASDSHGNLYTQFNGRPDLKNLTVYADTMTIRSALQLPETNVTIYTRHLRFDDTVGQAWLNTTPLPLYDRCGLVRQWVARTSWRQRYAAHL
jgi:hypothetical protein